MYFDIMKLEATFVLVQILALFLNSTVTLGKLLNL